MIKLSNYILVLFFILFGFSSFKSQVPKIKWWYNTFDFSAGQSTAKDIDGDGKLEVVFGCYRNDSSVYALNAENGTLLWRYNTSVLPSHGCNDVAPIIYDVDNNGTQEVIVPGSCTPKTFCINGTTGATTWTCNTRGSDSPPTIADIDNDGKPEIIHGEFNGYVIAINAENGTQAWEILVDGNSWVQTAPTIVDLDNNGILDFIVATWNFSNKDSIFAYRADNHTKLWSYPVHSHIYHGSSIADLDLDNKPEILIGAYNDTLYCINGENGSTNWKYKSSGYIGGPVSTGDIDNDGSCDVVFVGGSVVTVLSNTGVLKWSYTIPSFGQSFRGVALADINNDAYLDVIFGSNNGSLYALNGNNGSLIWSKDLRAHHGNSQFELSHAPLVADFDGDDTLDVFIVGGYGIYSSTNMTGNFGRAYMVSAGKGNGPNWTMFQRDIRRQSSLCIFNPTDINSESTNSNDLFTMFPNPSNANIQFKLYGSTYSKKTLQVFNSLGQSVFLKNDFAELEFNLDTKNWDEGVYNALYIDKTTNNVMSKKIIIYK
jgi:outer membrane protein assembly factor BamB